MRWSIGSGFSAMGMGVFYCQRDFQGKIRALAYHAFHLDLSFMCRDDGLHIAKTETEPFHIVQVAGMRAIKLLENAALGLFAHPDAVVFDTNDQAFGGVVG